MIISSTQYNVEPDIKVRLYTTAKSDTPFLVTISDGTTMTAQHMSLADVQRLSLQLTAALYEYDTEYEYKEAS
jgi:hypothetical protein